MNTTEQVPSASSPMRDKPEPPKAEGKLTPQQACAELDAMLAEIRELQAPLRARFRLILEKIAGMRGSREENRRLWEGISAIRAALAVRLGFGETPIHLALTYPQRSPRGSFQARAYDGPRKTVALYTGVNLPRLTVMDEWPARTGKKRTTST